MSSKSSWLSFKNVVQDKFNPIVYHYELVGWFALSFKKNLSTEQKTINPELIIGRTKNLTHLDRLSPARFEESSCFQNYLSRFMSSNYKSSLVLQNDAFVRKEGHINYPDYRNLPPFNRIPEIEDTLGFAMVNKGKLISYEHNKHNKHHRLLTNNGLFMLEPIILSKLIASINKPC